jgi:hypothetical protein
MTGLSPVPRMRITRALGATADDGGAAPGAAGSALAALDSEFGGWPSSVSSCEAEDVTFAGKGALEPTVDSNDPWSANDAVSGWRSPRIPDTQSAPATPPISKSKRNSQLAQQTRRRTEKPELGMTQIGMFHAFPCEQR